MECTDAGREPGWWALTGTPGTGKSSVARALPPQVLSVELRDLASGLSVDPPGKGPVEVDLGKLSAWMRRHPPPAPVLVAGYLSHRLPIDRVVVLRCHPATLEERLRRRHGRARELRENVQCEALDTIAGEARRGPRRTWEFDTTYSTTIEVAERVRRLMETGQGSTDQLDWLADPGVPPLLLRLRG
jgi:adenylate kinase